MYQDKAKAPSYDQLRPLKPGRAAVQARGSFPVYPGLAEHLATAKEHPDTLGIIPHVMATCAAYSYAGYGLQADAATVAMIMERMGLEQNRCRAFAQRVDAMFIASAAYLVQSEDRRVAILCYRGTQPEDMISVLTDADVAPEKLSMEIGGAEHMVHAGFYRNMRATRHAVISALSRAVEGQSILPEDGEDRGNPLERLYITGHSLGGAMAALMAVVLVNEPEYEEIADKLEAVYTFGQPLLGDQGFARACERTVDVRGRHFLRDRLLRYVYFRDVVPHLPPRPVGEYAPFGREFRYERALRPLDLAFCRVGQALEDLASLPSDMAERLGRLLTQLQAPPTAPAGTPWGTGTAPLAVGPQAPAASGQLRELAAALPRQTATAVNDLMSGLPQRARRLISSAPTWALNPLGPQEQGWKERMGAERSHSVQNLAGLTLVAPVAFLAVRLNLTRTLPFTYSFDDHMPTHYISRLAPPGVLSEFGDVR
ncbi:lipase family protein [Streptomyces ochraceiscleroticus]|uniref:Lipase family protein n=1 Tax=Streptomyces ochraceiscleroticus TaxID=47761 RepID=A0ABW1MIR3_9ACTN|nr:lipase family protein [Streptomyces ochraceiscleroticus]